MSLPSAPASVCLCCADHPPLLTYALLFGQYTLPPPALLSVGLSAPGLTVTWKDITEGWPVSLPDHRQEPKQSCPRRRQLSEEPGAATELLWGAAWAPDDRPSGSPGAARWPSSRCRDQHSVFSLWCPPHPPLQRKPQRKLSVTGAHLRWAPHYQAAPLVMKGPWVSNQVWCLTDKKGQVLKLKMSSKGSCR